VGDIITILIQENNGSTRRTTPRRTKRPRSMPASPASFTSRRQRPAHEGRPVSGDGMKSANNFAGGGKINNSETITARLAVRVIDVLPNGNMIVEGRRQTAFSGERSRTPFCAAWCVPMTWPPTTPSIATTWLMRASSSSARRHLGQPAQKAGSPASGTRSILFEACHAPHL